MFFTLQKLSAGWRERVGPRTRLVLKIAASLALLVLIFRLIDFRKLLAVLAGADLGLLGAALGLFVAGQMLNALKWAWLGEAMALPFDRLRYLRVYWMGLFVAVFLPGSLGGDVGRAVLLGRAGTRSWAAAYTVLADRYSGMLFLLVIGSLACTTIAGFDGLRPWLWSLSAGVALAWLALAPLSFYLAQRPTRFKAILDTIALWEKQLRRPAVLARVGSATLFIQLINWLVLVLIAAALHLRVAAAVLITVYSLITVATLAPVSINGLGVREGGYVLLLGLVGIAGEQALGFGVLWFAVYTGAALIGGLAWLLPIKAE